MYIKLRRNEQGVLQAHAEDPKRDRDRLFDLVMSLSDFAHEKGLTDVSLHLEEVLDTILETPRVQRVEAASRAIQRPALKRRAAKGMNKAQRLILTSDIRRKRQTQPS